MKRAIQRLAPILTRCAAAALVSGLAACGQLSKMRTPHVDVVQPTSARPLAVAAPTTPNGAIFQGAVYRPLFEDYRARLVGDTITVTITETISASQKTNSSIDKSGSVDASITALPFIKPTSKLITDTGATAASKNKFEGKASTDATNDFSGTITATVIEVLPNGHLIISGEKQIGVNQNVDVLKFSGQVDPRTIQPGNTVASTQIANVRVEHRGRGAQADAQEIGWIGRFFLSVLPL